MSDPAFPNRAASCTGVVRWRGWRLPFIDYEAWQHGRDVVFVLENEGDLMLVPVGLSGRTAAPGQRITGGEAEAALAAIREWEHTGWQVVGRLQTTFVGIDAEDDFWRATYRALARCRR